MSIIIRKILSNETNYNCNYVIENKPNFSINNFEINGNRGAYIYFNNYLIIYAKTNFNIYITNNSNEYTFLWKDTRVCFAYKGQLPNLTLYSNQIRICGMKIYGGTDENKVNNFLINDNDYFCNYLQDNNNYTKWKMTFNPCLLMLLKVINDPVIALCYLAQIIRNYFDYEFTIENNTYLKLKTTIQINKWDELLQRENKISKGTIPIITGLNNTSIKGFFTRQYTNVDYWHDNFNSLNNITNCRNLYISQILSTNPNHKPTLIIKNNTTENSFSFDPDESINYTEPNFSTSSAICIGDDTWPDIPIFNSHTRYETTGCQEGYRKKFIKTCNGAGNFSITSTTCEPEPEPEQIVCLSSENWIETPAGGSRTIDCPTGYTGQMTRTCNANGTWGNINSSSCVLSSSSNNSSLFCPYVYDSENNVIWIKTFASNEASIPCAFSGDLRRVCSSSGEWLNVDSSRCVNNPNAVPQFIGCVNDHYLNYNWQQTKAGQSTYVDCLGGKIIRYCGVNSNTGEVKWLSIDSSSCQFGCVASRIDGINIPATVAGSTVKVLCDNDSSSYVSIKCNADGTWGEIDTSECNKTTKLIIIIVIIISIIIFIISLAKKNTIGTFLSIIICIIVLIYGYIKNLLF